MKTNVRNGAVVIVLVLAAACGDSGPTSPTGITRPPVVLVPTAPPEHPISFPPLSGPSRTFTFDRELSFPIRDFTRKSSVVLYENGAFELQYPPNQYGSGVYRGAYRDADGVLLFLFEFGGRSIDAKWDDAAGSLERDSLTIRYSETMQHADFEDAVYVQMP